MELTATRNFPFRMASPPCLHSAENAFSGLPHLSNRISFLHSLMELSYSLQFCLSFSDEITLFPPTVPFPAFFPSLSSSSLQIYEFLEIWDSTEQWHELLNSVFKLCTPVLACSLQPQHQKKFLNTFASYQQEKTSPQTVTDNRYFHTIIQLCPSFIIMISLTSAASLQLVENLTNFQVRCYFSL